MVDSQRSEPHTCGCFGKDTREELDDALSSYRQSSTRIVGETISPVYMAETIITARYVLEKSGYTYLDGGSTRDVFKMPCGDCVVKIQPFGSSNNREIEMSSRGLQCLVPVTHHSICGGWLIMPYAEHSSSEMSNEDGIRYVKNRLFRSGWRVKELDEIGFIEDSPHVYDYGAPWERVQ